MVLISSVYGFKFMCNSCESQETTPQSRSKEDVGDCFDHCHVAQCARKYILWVVLKSAMYTEKECSLAVLCGMCIVQVYNAHAISR